MINFLNANLKAESFEQRNLLVEAEDGTEVDQRTDWLGDGETDRAGAKGYDLEASGVGKYLQGTS
ncbi:unnamed protein product [Dibothriocephalus latus]|uniref:Uncharacterized protein n=1 Tax=Dibothriocephalus latus TaxID=60516 RepID=A0A3P7P8T7_DIBLA|nr:unnamed protein product [Dibothriocephalus latus]